MNIKFIRGYFISFFRFYLFRKPKLILTIILSIFVFIWIIIIYNQLEWIINVNYFPQSPPEEISYQKEFIGYLAKSGNLFLIFIKPIFTYIAGLIIIKNI